MDKLHSLLQTILDHQYGWVLLVLIIVLVPVFAIIIAKGAKSILEKLLDVVQTMADNRKIELKTAQSAVSLLTKLVEDRFLTKEDKLKKLPKNNENKNRSTISNEIICLKKNKKRRNSNQARPKRKGDSSRR